MPPTRTLTTHQAVAHQSVAHQSVTLDVQRIDILNGIHGSTSYDPICFAIRRAIPDARDIRCSTVDVGFTLTRPVAGVLTAVRVVVETTPEMAAWIERFDARKDVRPVKFELMWEER